MSGINDEYLKAHKAARIRHRKLATVLLILSLAIALVVFWQLKLIGITMTGDAFCGIDEHSHSDECYSSVLLCTQEENEEHTHTDSCYETTLICEKSEHIHSSSCYSNEKADLETAKDWEETVSTVKLTEDISVNLLNIAKTQLGYKESTLNFKVDENLERFGYTRYGQWYGNPYGKWSAMFVSFCLNYCGAKDIDTLKNSGSESMRVMWEKRGIFVGDSYTAKQGDIIFLDEDADNVADRVGIVVSEYGEEISYISGDVDGEVTTVTLSENSNVCGYGLTNELQIQDEIAKKIEEEKIEAEPTGDSQALTGEEKESVDYCISLIEELDSYEQIEKKINEFEENERYEEEKEYLENLSLKASKAYAFYKELEGLRSYVSNSKDLFDIQPFWDSEQEDYALSKGSIPIHYINRMYSSGATAYPTIIHGGSAYDKINNPGYLYWDALVIEYDNEGNYYVAEIYKSQKVSNPVKSALKAASTRGFVLFVWEADVGAASLKAIYDIVDSVEVGDKVEISFDHKSISSGYKSSSYGNVSFGDDYLFEGTDNTKKLSTVESANTYDFIDINIFDYGNSINTMFNKDKKYPGFQQEYGTYSSVNVGGGSNFGNSLTADMLAGINGVAKIEGSGSETSVGRINWLAPSPNAANRPTSGAMYPTMLNGYPALADGSSLSWLFSNNASTTTTKQNTDNITGLFIYDEKTGAYSFNSRENHAQFEPKTNTITLYNQIITPNYIWYPFGNFLPLNDITKKATQVSTINENYFTKIAKRAAVKAANGGDSKYSSISKTPYASMKTTMPAYITAMNSAKGSGWTAMDSINAYFSAMSPIPDTFEHPSGNATYLKNMYNIDYDIESDFYLGMDIHMNYMQPKGGMTGPKGDQKMQFSFTGDDDVWVYIDGILFLDLSGIHRHVGGKIDFVDGKVYYYQLDLSIGDVDMDKPYKTVTFKQILSNAGYDTSVLNSKGTFADYTSHKFDFYYMERGSGSGVCRMNFNFPILQKNTVSVSKNVSCDEEIESLGNASFAFQLLKADSKGNKTEELFVPPGTKYEIRSAQTDEILGTAVTDSTGVFKIKAGQKAYFTDINENAGKYYVRELLDRNFYIQYGKVTVDGHTVTTDTYDNSVVVGSGTFVGFDSEVKDATDGSTTFAFNNNIDVDKLGSLAITKKLESYSDTAMKKGFKFKVTLDGEEIESGVNYYVVSDENPYPEYKTVQDGGIIVLDAGQTAFIEKIIAGSYYTVTELNSIENGYVVAYNPTQDGSCAEGFVGASTQTEVEIVNSESGVSVDIPITKKVINPDGAIRDFDFSLIEVKDKDGSPSASAVTQRSLTLSTAKSENGVFTLGYASQNFTGTNAVYYYLIEEVAKDSDKSVSYDSRKFVAEITVSKTQNGEIIAELTGVYLNGEKLSSNEIVFENTIGRSLSVSKIIHPSENTEVDYETLFNFQIDLKDSNGAAISGTFPIVYNDSEAKEITFENGQALISLKHGETATISSLPSKAQWKVTELDTSGWDVYTKTNGASQVAGSSSSGVLEENAKVEFINLFGFRLPETGGIGTHILTIIGLSLMLSSVLYSILRRRRERRLTT